MAVAEASNAAETSGRSRWVSSACVMARKNTNMCQSHS